MVVLESYPVSLPVGWRSLLPIITVFALATSGAGCDRAGGKQQPVSTSLYVWSDAFQKHDNAFLLELDWTQEIDRLIVSAGHNTSMKKLRLFQKQAREKDLEVELLLASNHWVRSGGIERAQDRLENLELRGSPLHLDVEPHALDDFEQRQDELLRRYLEVLRLARRTIGESELAVSIPLFWPDWTYRKVSKIVDRTYLMAYGEKSSQERANQILKVSRHFDSEQRVVALRPEDYGSPDQLDRGISALRETVGISQYALHDLERFLQFDENSP